MAWNGLKQENRLPREFFLKILSKTFFSELFLVQFNEKGPNTRVFLTILNKFRYRYSVKYFWATASEARITQPEFTLFQVNSRKTRTI